MTHHTNWLRSQLRGYALLAIGTAIAVLIVYLPTIAPSITWRNGGADSGDFAAAIASSGIPHPPGYPTYVLLGQIWTTLPFPGDLAYQLNLLSAVSAAVAIGLSVFTISLMGREIEFTGLPLVVGSEFGGIMLALAPLVWSQATITEIYASGLMFVSLMSLLLFWWWYKNKRWALMAAGLALGLGLGVFPQLT
jgi:hypothetical protein